MATEDSNTSTSGNSQDEFFSTVLDDALTLESLFSAIIKFDGDKNGSGDVLMLAHLGKKMARNLTDRMDLFSLSLCTEASHG